MQNCGCPSLSGASLQCVPNHLQEEGRSSVNLAGSHPYCNMFYTRIEIQWRALHEFYVKNIIYLVVAITNSYL